MTGLILRVMRAVVRLAGVNPVPTPGKASENALPCARSKAAPAPASTDPITIAEPDAPVAVESAVLFEGWTVRQMAVEIVRLQDAFHSVPLWAPVGDREPLYAALDHAWTGIDYLGHRAVVADMVRQVRAERTPDCGTTS